jgi:hypothetical protein
MPAIAMGLLWGGYTLMFWGYTTYQGYQITLPEIVIPGRWRGSWPPPGAATLGRFPSQDGSGGISGSIGTIPGRGAQSGDTGQQQPPTLI